MEKNINKMSASLISLKQIIITNWIEKNCQDFLLKLLFSTIKNSRPILRHTLPIHCKKIF